MTLPRRTFLRQIGAACLAGSSLYSRAEPAAVHCVYGEDYLPWSGCMAAPLHGLAADLLNAFLKEQLKLVLKHSCLPWKRAQFMVESGAADVMCTIPTEPRRDYALVSSVPIFSTSARIYISRKSPLSEALSRADSLAALRRQNPVVLTYLGSGWTVDRLAGFRTDIAPNMSNCIKMLALGRGDLMVENRLVMQAAIGDLRSEIIAAPFDMEDIHYHLMISKKSPHTEIMPRVNSLLPAFKATAAYKSILAGYSAEA